VWRAQGRLSFLLHPDIFQPISPLVFHNDGNGRFTEVSQKIGLSKPGKGLGIAVGDYDHDDKIDVFVANDSMVEFLYHNKGDGNFEEVGLLSQVAVDGDGRTYAGMGVDFADYNNDGWPDLLVTDLANQRYALYKIMATRLSPIPVSAPDSHDSPCCIPAGARAFLITTMMDGKI